MKVLICQVNTHGIGEAQFVCRSYLSRNRTIGSSVCCICSPNVVLLDCSHVLSSCPLSLMFPSLGPRKCTYIFSTYAFFFCQATWTQICQQEYTPVHVWLSSMKVTLGCVHVQLRFVWWRWMISSERWSTISLDVTRTDSNSYPVGYHPSFPVFQRAARKKLLR